MLAYGLIIKILINACELRLDDEVVCAAVALTLAVALSVSRPCPCGAHVDACGVHSLM